MHAHIAPARAAARRAAAIRTQQLKVSSGLWGIGAAVGQATAWLQFLRC